MEKLKIEYARFNVGKNLKPLDRTIKEEFERETNERYKSIIPKMNQQGAYIMAWYSQDGKSITESKLTNFTQETLDLVEEINNKIRSKN